MKTNSGHKIVSGTQALIEFFFSMIAVCVIPGLFLSSVVLAMQVTGLINDGNAIASGFIWASGMILTISIEGASVGSFDLAAQMEARGHKERAGGIKAMAWVLTAIVIITLGFAVFHVAGLADDLLRGVRVAAAVLYALAAHSQGGTDQVTQDQHNQIQEMFLQFRNEQVAGIVSHCLDKVRQGSEAEIRLFLDTMRQENEAHMSQAVEAMRQESEAKVRQAVEAMRQEQDTALQQLQAASKETPRPSPSHQPAHSPETKDNIVNLREVNTSKDALKAEAYRLNDVEGLSSYEIAGKINKPASTVQRWLRDRSNGGTEEANGTEE